MRTIISTALLALFIGALGAGAAGARDDIKVERVSFERVLIFNGEKVSSDADAQVEAEKSGDLWVIEVNDYEHYRIPEAVITGG